MQGRATTRPTHHQISTHAKKSWFSGMTAGDFADKVGLSRRFNTHGNEKELVMRKIITFLGVGHYEKTTYRYNEVDYQTQFCVAAIVNALNAIQEKPIEQVLVCVTDEAKAKNYPNLEEALQAFGVVCQPIQIPNGKNEQELWQIFRAITDQIKDDDEIWFDITNSFRSLPFVVFLVVAFLRQVQNVSVKRVLYGAYEKSVVITPILDLTKFVQMLDWMNATAYFTNLGDSQQLAKLLRDEVPSKNQLAISPEARNLRKSLETTASLMENMSSALMLARPLEVLDLAQVLPTRFNDVRANLGNAVRPFQVLQHTIISEYSQFAGNGNIWHDLCSQFKLIEWYIGHGLSIQAATLAREWVVSVLAAHFGYEILDTSVREDVEKVLNNLNPEQQEKVKLTDHQLALIKQVESLPNDVGSDIRNLWEGLRNLRNDIAHVGMRKNPDTASSLSKQIKKRLPELIKLYKQLAIVG